jgi:hypothetical protein
MKRNHLNPTLALLAFVAIGGIAIAQTANEGRRFPYVGYLEEDGFAVTGTREMRVSLHTAPTGGTACMVYNFTAAEAVEVNEGRFQVELTEVPDVCLTQGTIYASITIDPLGDDITLQDKDGIDRVVIGAVPFAAASPELSTFIVPSDAEVLGSVLVPNNTEAALGSGGSVVIGPTGGNNIALDSNEIQARDNGAASRLDLNPAGGTTRFGGALDADGNDLRLDDGTRDHALTGVDALYDDTGVELRALTNPGDGQPIFRVLSEGGAERLRVEHNGTTSVTNDFAVTGNIDVDGNLEAGHVLYTCPTGGLGVGYGTADCSCPASAPRVLGGGGVCQGDGYIHQSRPVSASQWRVSCAYGAGYAFPKWVTSMTLICARIAD